MLRKIDECPHCGVTHVFDLRYTPEDTDLTCTTCGKLVKWNIIFTTYNGETYWWATLLLQKEN